MNTKDRPDTPIVSVCIPTYRGANHLCAAIESVLNQSFSNLELIIINDNSPDHTDEVVSSYTDTRIRYIKNSTNLGPEGNWNKCLSEAKGKYFKLLPQDDILDIACLSEQIKVLENDEDHMLALVFCARHIIDNNGKKITTRGYPRGKQGVMNNYDVIRKNIQFGTNLLGEPGAVLFRKSLANQVGAFDGSISYIIDLDYWFRLLLHGNAFYINSPLASFRVATGSWSVEIGSRQGDDFTKFIKRCLQNPQYRLTDFDFFLGQLAAKLNNYLRLVFYKIYVAN